MIMKRQMTGLFVLFMFVFPVLFASAQQDRALQAYGGQSNTNLATAGLFFEDRDLFLSTVDIGGISKNLFFLNFVAPSYFGGPAGGVFDDDGPNAQYNYYFDAGAGHFFGPRPFWAGTAFQFGSSTKKNKTDTKKETAKVDSNGIQYGVDSTTINGDGNYNTIDNLVGISAIFGTKTWAIKNSLEIKNNRFEGYGNASMTGAPGLLTLDTISISSVAAGGDNIVTTTDAVGRVTTVSNTYSEGTIYRNDPANGVLNAWYNTIEGGVVLGDLVPALQSLSPWAVLSVKFGLDQNESIKGFSHDYSQADSASIGVYERKSITYDAAKAHFDIIPALAFGISLPLDDIFTFSPELSYSPAFYAYSNKYGDGGTAVKGTVVYQTGSQWTYGGVAADGGRIEDSVTYNMTTISEITQIGQELSAGLKLSADFDRFSLALKYVPTLNTLSEKSTDTVSSRKTTRAVAGQNPYNNYTVTVETTQDAGGADKSTVVFTSDFKIGAQLWVKPEKFRLNAGAVVSAKTESITTRDTDKGTSKVTTTTTYDDGHQNPAVPSSMGPVTVTTIAQAAYTQTYTSGTDYSGDYYMGCTYFFNDNLNLDFYLSNSANDGYAENNWAQLLMPSTWALQINIRY
ncbi:MAG: hypothetical protein LBF78_12165 [Treponema sp.]|jgi:hypothetical protein|nr:hypothetical protein [Treponema sp.]